MDDIMSRCALLQTMGMELKQRRTNCEIKPHCDRNVKRYLHFATKFLLNNKQYFEIISEHIYNNAMVQGEHTKKHKINRTNTSWVMMKPLITAKTYLLHTDDPEMSRILHFYEMCLQFHLSYAYFTKSTKKKYRENFIFENMSRFLTATEKYIFNEIKTRNKGTDTVTKNKLFHLRIFIYAFTFDILSHWNEKALYNKIILLKDSLKVLCSLNTENAPDSAHYLEFMNFLHNQKIQMDKNGDFMNSNYFEVNESILRNEQKDVTDIQWTKGNLWNLKEKYDNSMLKSFLKSKRNRKNWGDVHFENLWVRNIFEIINNIYVSYFILIQNKKTHMSILLNGSNVEKNGIQDRDDDSFFKEEPNKRNRNIEQFLIQTKSFSRALNFLTSRSENSRTTVLEDIILKNVLDLSKKLEINNYGVVLKEEDSANESERNSLNENEEESMEEAEEPTECSSDEDFQNVTFRLDVGDKKKYTDYCKNEQKMSKKYDILFYYEFFICNINLKYLSNSFVHLLNIYMRVAFNVLHNTTDAVVQDFKKQEEIRKREHAALKSILHRLYIYLENMDNAIFISEEKIEMLSLLKEKFGLLEFYENKITDENLLNKSIRIIFNTIEEILHIFFAFLMNVYIIRDKNYYYEKEDSCLQSCQNNNSTNIKSNPKMYRRNVFAVKRARNFNRLNDVNSGNEEFCSSAKNVEKNKMSIIGNYINHITFEEYTIFKKIYYNEAMKNVQNNYFYSYYNSAVFNKTIVFDSLLNMYKEINKNKIYLVHLNISNFVFQNVKRNYYDFIMTQSTTDFPMTYTEKENCSFWKWKKEKRQKEIHILNRNSLCYFFIFYTCTVLQRIIKEYEEEEAEEEGTIINGNEAASFFFQMYNAVINYQKVSIGMFTYLLKLYDYFSYLKMEGKLSQRIEKYIFVLLGLLFQVVLFKLTDGEENEFYARGGVSCDIGKNEESTQNKTDVDVANMHNMADEVPSVWQKNAKMENYCSNRKTSENSYLDMAYAYLQNSEKIHVDTLRGIIKMLFSGQKMVLELVDAYEEEFIYYVGALYLSHFFIGVVSVEIKKQVKELYKKMEVKNYYKKVGEYLKEEIYMSNQQHFYTDRMNLFEQMPHENYFKVQKEGILNGYIARMKQELPILPPIKGMGTKKQKRKLSCITKIINEEENEEGNVKEKKHMQRSTNMCTHIITNYLHKNDSGNFCNMYRNLKNCLKGFLRGAFSFSNVESILYEIKERGEMINYSIIYMCLNFMHHVKEQYGLLLKIQHSIVYALNVFIHSIHNMNSLLLRKKEERKATTFFINPIEKKNKEKQGTLYTYVDFPVQFNKILNFPKENYGNIEPIEYLKFAVKLMVKPKDILTHFSFANVLSCLKKICTQIVVSNEMDEVSDMNELYRIEQFKNSATKEKYETLEETYIEETIEEEVNDLFYSKEYFADQIKQGKEKEEEVEDEEEEKMNKAKNRRQEKQSSNNEQIKKDEQENKSGSNCNIAYPTDDTDTKKINEEKFNQIIYHMIQMFKKKGINNHLEKSILLTKENIRQVLDFVIQLNDFKNDASSGKEMTFLLNKENEEKNLLIFTLNLVDQLEENTNYSNDKFSYFKKKMLEVLLSDKRSYIYVNKCIQLTDATYEDLFGGALNHLCHSLKNLKKFFIPIYNKNNNLTVFNILNSLDNILHIPMQGLKEHIEKIILRLEHIIDLINSLKRFNFINFDEKSVKQLTNFTETEMFKELLTYTIYFRLLKLEKLKSIRKELNRKILKTKTLNLFSYLFFLCYSDQAPKQKENKEDEKEQNNQNSVQTQIEEKQTNHQDVIEEDQKQKSLFQLKIIKTFETLIVFLRNSMIGEFSFRLNLIFFIGFLFKNSNNENERIMSNVFLNVYNYMYIYYPLIKKKIKMSKNYFNKKLKKMVANIHLDLIDVEAYKSSIRKLKSHIVYFTKLYFQQIRITVDRFIMENTSASFDTEGRKKGSFVEHKRGYQNEKENEKTETLEFEKVEKEEEEIGSDISIEEFEWNENSIEECSDTRETDTNKASEKKREGQKEETEEEIETTADVKNHMDEMSDAEESVDTEEKNEENEYIINELEHIKISLCKFGKKIKKVKMNEFLINQIDTDNTFEALSYNCVREIKNILHYKCVDANVNQKIRWLYILKHFFWKKLQMPYIRDLNNFSFFANLFTTYVTFNDVHENSLFEFDSPEELLSELKGSLAYGIQRNTVLSEEMKSSRYTKLKEELEQFESTIKEQLNKRKVYSLQFLNKMNSILQSKEQQNSKIIYLIIYIKSIKMHEDIQQDEKLKQLFNSIIYEYFNLRKEMHLFYIHYVFYYLMSESILMERKSTKKCAIIHMSLFKQFLLKCNLAKTTMLQIVSVFYLQISEHTYFKTLLYTVYKILYIIMCSNEFVVFRYCMNTNGSAVLKELSLECTQLHMKVGKQFIECLKKSIKFLKAAKKHLFDLPIATYLKIKLHDVLKQLVSAFSLICNSKQEEKEPVSKWKEALPEQCNDIKKMNSKLFLFIKKNVLNKSLLHKENYYPNFKETKTIYATYSLKEINQLHLQFLSFESPIFKHIDLLKDKIKQKKHTQHFFYLTKNLSYLMKGIFLSLVDTYSGFTNITFYFLKIMKLLYTKGYCREIQNEKEDEAAKNEQTEEDNTFHKVDFLKGIGLGEGRGINNISDQVDNEDLDNICREEEQPFSEEDEREFDEDAIEASYDFKQFRERELDNFDKKNDNPNKLENEQDNWNMEDDKTRADTPLKEKKEQQKEKKGKEQTEKDTDHSDTSSQLEENIDDIFDKNKGTNENANEQFLQKPDIEEDKEKEKKDEEEKETDKQREEENDSDEEMENAQADEVPQKEEKLQQDTQTAEKSKKEKDMGKKEQKDRTNEKDITVEGQEFSNDEMNNMEENDVSELPNYENKRREEKAGEYFDDNMNKMEETGHGENDNNSNNNDLDNIFDSDFKIESSDFSDTFSDKSVGDDIKEDETAGTNEEMEQDTRDQDNQNVMEEEEKQKRNQLHNEDNLKNALDEMENMLKAQQERENDEEKEEQKKENFFGEEESKKEMSNSDTSGEEEEEEEETQDEETENNLKENKIGKKNKGFKRNKDSEKETKETSDTDEKHDKIEEEKLTDVEKNEEGNEKDSKKEDEEKKDDEDKKEEEEKTEKEDQKEGEDKKEEEEETELATAIDEEIEKQTMDNSEVGVNDEAEIKAESDTGEKEEEYEEENKKINEETNDEDMSNKKDKEDSKTEKNECSDSEYHDVIEYTDDNNDDELPEGTNNSIEKKTHDVSEQNKEYEDLNDSDEQETADKMNGMLNDKKKNGECTTSLHEKGTDEETDKKRKREETMEREKEIKKTNDVTEEHTSEEDSEQDEEREKGEGTQLETDEIEMSMENGHSKTDEYSLKIDECNLYTENVVDITNFVDKLNESLFNPKNKEITEQDEKEKTEQAQKEETHEEERQQNSLDGAEDSSKQNDPLDRNGAEKEEKKKEMNLEMDSQISRNLPNSEKWKEQMKKEEHQRKRMEKEKEKEKENEIEKEKEMNTAQKILKHKLKKEKQEPEAIGEDVRKEGKEQTENEIMSDVIGDSEEEIVDDIEMNENEKLKDLSLNEETTDDNISTISTMEEQLKKTGNLEDNEEENDIREIIEEQKETKEDKIEEAEYQKVHENWKVLEEEYVLANEPSVIEKIQRDEKIRAHFFNLQNEKMYEEISNETELMSSQLCEQLKMILEPTVRNKYEGDYKSGKKLNIKKLVNYFASDFRNNKIWKRKTKLSKRDYNILIAIDNTKSMKINNIQKMTVNAIFLVAKAFEKLNVGKIGICSFGEKETVSTENIVCSMTNTLNKQDFLKILNHFQFNHDTKHSFDTAMLNALQICSHVFKTTGATANSNNSKNDINHLMLIISDGRFNKNSVKEEIYKCIQNNFIPVLMIIDAQLSNSKSQSIFNLKQTFYKNNKLHIVPYLNNFPFPYFVVVNNINNIPTMTCEIIRQWFQLLNTK